MRIMLDSPATPLLPISMLLSPVVRLTPAFAPNAMLPLPVMLFESAESPMAVLLSPVVLLNRANAPLAVLKSPVTLISSAAVPVAVLFVPMMLNKSAAVPMAVLLSAMLRSSDAAPTAVLLLPVVTLNNEKLPIAVFATPEVRALKGVVSRSSGEVGIAPRGRRVDRFRFRQKPEAEEREYDEKWWSCFELNQWIHRCHLSFSRWLTLRLRGLKEGKKTTGRGSLTLPRIQICF